jgi:hypothetical protein
LHQRVQLAPAGRNAARDQLLELGARIAGGNHQVGCLALLSLIALEPGAVAFGASHRGDVAAKPILRSRIDGQNISALAHLDRCRLGQAAADFAKRAGARLRCR